MPSTALTKDILLAALAAFQLDKQRIDAQIAEVEAMLGSGGSPLATPATAPSVPEESPKKGKRKKFSAVSRRRMAEAQKARWAKIKGESEPLLPVTPVAVKVKRQISAEGLKRISAASKKRWRLQKAAAKLAKKVSPKKAAVKKTAPAKKTAAKKTATKKSAPLAAEPAV